MNPDDENLDLNTEPNDIAGNRVDGPMGNTAAYDGPVVGQPSSTGAGAQPGHGHAGAARPGSEPGSPNNPIAEIPGPANDEHHASAGASAGQPSETYGGPSPVPHDAHLARAHHDNQTSNANRGEFGAQSNQGATHSGFGNQFREGITEHQGPAEAQYYGDGNTRRGAGDHNAYRDYDGRDERPDVLPTSGERAVHDTPAAGAATASPAPTDGRGNAVDNRNQPDRHDAAAAHQNDNGAPQAAGAGFATDYGHSSGAGMPGTAGQPQATPAAAGRNQAEDQRSSRGGYDNQGSAGGEHREADQPASSSVAPAPAGADAPHAPQGQGYGYGYQQSEQPRQPNRNTGSERQGSTPGTQLASHGGDSSQGYGSRGGSYDDQNPGAHPGGLDQTTHQSQAAQNGPENRAEQRPNDNADITDYGSSPRRSAGRGDE